MTIEIILVVLVLAGLVAFIANRSKKKRDKSKAVQGGGGGGGGRGNDHPKEQE